MSKAVDLNFGAQTSYEYGTSPYTASALGLGPLMIQRSGSVESDKWAGPLPVSIIRPVDSTTWGFSFPWAMRWSNRYDWVFFGDQTAANSFRRILKTTYDRTTGDWYVDGIVWLEYNNTTAHTLRALRMTYDLITTGSVWGVEGSTSISGSSTTFTSSQACIGNRIGFGTTVPSDVTQWYEIAAITSDTRLNLKEPLLSNINTSSFVIEDLRAITVTTNATTTSGGVYVAKGLRADMFIPSGSRVTGSASTDNSRSVYWLPDGVTQTNITSLGAGLEDKLSDTTQYLWVVDGLTNSSLYKYNIRKPLTVVSSTDRTAFVLRTSGNTITGTPSQNNNGRIAKTAHGPGSGSTCIYFTTATKIYRSFPLDQITTGSVNWLADVMSEIAPGGAGTTTVFSLFQTAEYASMIDRFVVVPNVSSTPNRSYVTQYKTDISQMDRMFGHEPRQFDTILANLDAITITPLSNFNPWSVWSEGGITYLCTSTSTLSAGNRAYAFPLSADWEFTGKTKSVIITPKFSTPLCDRFVRLYVNRARTLGSKTGMCLGQSPEDFRICWRTAGIDDDSGTWNKLNCRGDLTQVAGAAAIQFKIEFRIISLLCIPARIHSLALLYEEASTDDHFQPSAAKSSLTNAQFTWRFSRAFGTAVPTLRVRLYDAVTGNLLVDDDTETSARGAFQKSTNGSTWGSYDSTDKGNENTYIRYTPTYLPSGTKIRPVLSVKLK